MMDGQEVNGQTQARIVRFDNGDRTFEIPAGGLNRISVSRRWCSERAMHRTQVIQWFAGVPLVQSDMAPRAAWWFGRQFEGLSRIYLRAFQPAHQVIDLHFDSMIDGLRAAAMFGDGAFGTDDGLPCSDEDRAIIVALDARSAVVGVRCGLCSHYVLTSATEHLDAMHAQPWESVAELRERITAAAAQLTPDSCPDAHAII